MCVFGGTAFKRRRSFTELNGRQRPVRPSILGHTAGRIYHLPQPAACVIGVTDHPPNIVLCLDKTTPEGLQILEAARIPTAPVLSLLLSEWLN